MIIVIVCPLAGPRRGPLFIVGMGPEEGSGFCPFVFGVVCVRWCVVACPSSVCRVRALVSFFHGECESLSLSGRQPRHGKQSQID